MSGWAASLAIGRDPGAPTEQSVLVTPSDGVRQGQVGVIVVHGAGATAGSFMQASLRWQVRFNHALCAAGFTIMAPDLRGVATWGSDIDPYNVVAGIESARNYMVGLGCSGDKVCLVGTSMGGLNSLNYTRTYPSRVASLTGFIPVSDIEDARLRGFGVNIETAWGIGAGGALPSRANPNTAENAATIKSSGADIGLYYSTADTIITPSTVESLATKLGVIPRIIDTINNHSDENFKELPITEIIQRLRAVGA